jgi:hypothetical protein
MNLVTLEGENYWIGNFLLFNHRQKAHGPKRHPRATVAIIRDIPNKKGLAAEVAATPWS